MDSPLITILLPVYNGEKTIKTTLQSLLNQTFTSFELLIGIDGTTDASKDIALSFNDPRIKIIEHPKNLGLANNLNKIIKHATPQSKYFAMAEQDDVYVPERLEWQVEVMEKHDDVGLVSGIVEYIGVKKNRLFPGLLLREEQFPQGKALFKFLYVNQLKVVNTCMLWRKSVHQNNNFRFNNTYGNFNVDWDYVLRFCLKSKVYGIPKKLVTMNRGLTDDSVTRDFKGQSIASHKLLKDFKSEFPNLINLSHYKDALKTQYKVELGNNSKFRIIYLSLKCAFIFNDIWFLKYLINKFKEKLYK